MNELFRRHRFLLFALGLTLLCSSAHGQAVITWNAALTISGDANVSTQGTLVRAFNLGPAGVAQVAVNGVTFESFVFPDHTSNTATVGNFTFVESPSVLFPGDDAGHGSGTFAGLSANYQTLLSTYGAADAEATLTLTVSGLTVGRVYQFQWWNNHSNNAGTNYTTSATAGNAVSLDANVGNTAGNVGQFAIGTFTASGTTQAIAFTGDNLLPSLSAFQLRDLTAVPEPSTYALLAGAAAVAFAFWRRRWRM